MKDNLKKERKNPIEEILETALSGLKTNIMAESVVGEPIIAGGKTIIPISKVSVGYIAGGGEYAGDKHKDYPISGGSGGGYSVSPMGFLVIDGKNVKLVSIAEKTLYTKLLELIPETTKAVLEGFNAGGKKK